MRRHVAVLLGFGRIGAGLVRSARATAIHQYVCHAQVLRDHPAIDWVGVTDFDETARRAASVDWGVPHVAENGWDLVRQVGFDREAVTLAVLATPPDFRTELLDPFPNLKGVVVEKPLGLSHEHGQRFISECARRDIAVQVNYWRRGDDRLRSLGAAGLTELVGTPQKANIIYGNGLINNGSHLLDYSRFLFGEIEWVQSIHQGIGNISLPIPDDYSVDFAVGFQSGLILTAQALDFAHYRENAIDIWGTCGRLSIIQESTVIQLYERRTCRQLEDAYEVASDRPIGSFPPFEGRALWNLADNLIGHLEDARPLHSSGNGALKSEFVLHAVLESAAKNGERVWPMRM